MNNNSFNREVSYCGALVREADADRFLLSMFLPADIREDVWAVLAYNYEISKTREVVSESTLGLIRLQWWRDAIGDIYAGKVLEHEVLKPLALAIERHDLPREGFDKMAYAREFDLEDVSPANLEGLMNYADFTTSPLFEQIVKITGDDPAEHAIQPVAINYALAGIVRATKVFARQHRFYLPENLMGVQGLTQGNFFDEGKRDAVGKVIKGVCKSRLCVSKPEHVFLKACECLSEIYFKQMKGLGYDVMGDKIERPPAFKVLRLYMGVNF